MEWFIEWPAQGGLYRAYVHLNKPELRFTRSLLYNDSANKADRLSRIVEMNESERLA